MYIPRFKACYIVAFSLLLVLQLTSLCLAQTAETATSESMITPIDAKEYDLVIDNEIELLDGLSVAVSRSVPTFLYKGTKIVTPKLTMHRVLTCETFKQDDTKYWAVAVFTGGAHCCVVTYIFSMPSMNGSMTYIGKKQEADHYEGDWPYYFTQTITKKDWQNALQ